MMRKFIVLVLLISFFLSSCDFYTAYLIKKSLSGDFKFIDDFSRKYKLVSNSFSDVPVSEEEKIVPEFVEDKVLLTDLEEQLIPGSKEKPSEIIKLFTSKDNTINIDLPKEDGIWIIKKYPAKISKLSKNSDIAANKFIFEITSFGKDNATFNLISSNGVVTKVLEYEITSSEISPNSNFEKTPSLTNTKTNNYPSSSNKTSTSKTGNLETKTTNLSSININNSTNKDNLDLTDEEKQEKTVEPTPPSMVGKFDIKTLFGNEKKYFEYVDNIAKKYGYYTALKEIEKIETNISEIDLPKMKFKKMEIYDALGKYNDAINEGQGFIDKDNMIKLYVGIINGKAKNYYIADKNIKEALNSLVEPEEIKFALSKTIDYYLSIPEVPTREMINTLLQKNEFLQKEYKKDYQLNLIRIANLFERIGELYKAKAIYDQVYNQTPDEEIMQKLNESKERLEKITNYK